MCAAEGCGKKFAKLGGVLADSKWFCCANCSEAYVKTHPTIGCVTASLKTKDEDKDINKELDDLLSLDM